jgi:hypothetical protein
MVNHGISSQARSTQGSFDRTRTHYNTTVVDAVLEAGMPAGFDPQRLMVASS